MSGNFMMKKRDVVKRNNQHLDLKNKYTRILNGIDELKGISEFKSDITNPLLNLGKPVIENFKRLDRNIENDSRLYFFLNLCLFIPHQIMNITKHLLHHLKYFQKYKSSYTIQDKTNYLFLSHFTGQSDVDLERDAFYGSVPFRKQDNQMKNILVYIDHSIQKKSIRNHPLILSKTCETNIRMKLLAIALRNAYQYLKKGIIASRSNVELANKYLYLARIQTEIASLANQILEHNLDKQISRLRPKKIVITLEGHPYELALAQHLTEFHKEISIIFWQLAPVVPNQHGFIENISRFPSEINVGVTSSAVKLYIQSKIEIQRKISVFGSPKFNETDNFENKGECILLAPEGTEEATDEFLEIISELCLNLNHRKIILRLHPRLATRNIQSRLSKLHNLKNFELSKQTLFSDLSRSEYCVFRSSSVGIESMNFGVQPIHFSFFTQNEINPLALLEIDLLEAQNLNQLVSIIQQKKKASVDSLRKYYRLYYEPFNESNFLSI